MAHPLGVLLVGFALPAQVSVSLDLSRPRPVSPLVFGMNYPSDAQVAQGGVTVARWGGNSTTRYNYLVDMHNTGADWYFENLPGCWSDSGNYCSPPPSDPREQSSANAFLSRTSQQGMVALFTVPIMGFVPKGPARFAHPFECGCPRSVQPNQNSFDTYEPGCGDGQSSPGHAIDCGPSTQTSIAIDPAWVGTWIAYIVQKHGPSNGRRIYALDNEPALWSSTHRDVRTTRLTYDELWQRMRDYAVAVLDADPTALIAGPAEWGWPNYLCSDMDVGTTGGCGPTSPDRAAHGGTELVAWLLQQARAYEQQNGRRILHYLDLHYYPQGGSGPENVRSLWDPTYTDPSWIAERIRLLPRMRDWVDQHYPGTKLAISEYDFYAHDTARGAITYAEVLGTFATQGLDLATAWAPPDPAQPAFLAWKLFRNFDGAGGRFEDNAVDATVTGTGVRAYAAAAPGRLTLVLVNERSTAVPVDVSLGGFRAGGVARVHAGSTAITPQPDVAVAEGRVRVTVPATAFAMVVVDGAGGPVASSSSTASSGPAPASGGGTATSQGGGPGDGDAPARRCACAGTRSLPPWSALLVVVLARRRVAAARGRT